MKKKILTAACFALLSGASLASNMAAKINSKYPNLKVESAQYISDIKLYELKMKGNPSYAYTNESMDYFLIDGEIIDVKNKVNYSKDREFGKVKTFFKSLPFDKSITIKYGNGQRRMAIFTDPDCPFCKRLDNEIHSYLKNENITVHYFMNPLNIPGHEDAPKKAARIWCAKDRGKAWTDWMINGVLPDNDGSCKNPVAETKKLSTESGFNATPTIIFDNGYTAQQAMSAQDIMKVFEAKKP